MCSRCCLMGLTVEAVSAAAAAVAAVVSLNAVATVSSWLRLAFCNWRLSLVMQRGQSQGALPAGRQARGWGGHTGRQTVSAPASRADAINHNKRPHCAQGSRTMPGQSPKAVRQQQEEVEEEDDEQRLRPIWRCFAKGRYSSILS